MPFEFRLEVPLRLARARRDQGQRELAVALRELAAAEALYDDARGAAIRIGDEMTRRTLEGIAGSELHALTEGREAARARLPRLLARARQAAAREQEIRAALAAAGREVKVLEKLRAEAWRDWRRNLARREQAAIDDVVLVRRARERADTRELRATQTTEAGP